MTTREKFKRRVIELIHGLTYEEAMKKEVENITLNANDVLYDAFECTRCWGAFGLGTMSEDDFRPIADDPWRVEEIFGENFPITLSRVMQALHNKMKELDDIGYSNWCDVFIGLSWRRNWQLTTKDGATCTDDSQSDETIESLYNLIK